MLFFLTFLIIFCIVAIFLLLSKKAVDGAPQTKNFALLDENGDPLPDGADVPDDDDDEPQNEHDVKRLNHFCVSVWPLVQEHAKCLEFHIAGLYHRENIEDYIGEFHGVLVSEPDNRYDPNAIKVLAPDGHHVGYVPAYLTATVRQFAPLPCPCFCFIGMTADTFFSDCYILKN